MTCDSQRSTAVHHSIARVRWDSTDDSPAVITAHDCSSGRITAKVSSPELGTTTLPANSSSRTGSAPRCTSRVPTS